MTERLLHAILLASFLIVPLSSCSEGDEAPLNGSPQDGSIAREYMLSINDTRAEVRQTCTAGSEVPWAAGPQSRRCESHLLTTQDGFVFPDAFLAHWPDELTRVLVDYEHPEENGYACSGWVLYDSPGTSEPSAHVQFSEPVVFIPAQAGPSQTTTRASIMKRDSTSLFDPRGGEAGRPELEGEGIVTLVCDNIVRSDGHTGRTQSGTLPGAQINSSGCSR